VARLPPSRLRRNAQNPEGKGQAAEKETVLRSSGKLNS
jgi:hypothetical protein